MGEPIIADSARKRGIPDEDILHAYRNAIRSEYVDEGLTMLAGPARDASLVEVGVVEGEDGPVIVHAMRARKQYLPGGGTR
jgi:hypothetical protein